MQPVRLLSLCLALGFLGCADMTTAHTDPRDEVERLTVGKADDPDGSSSDGADSTDDASSPAEPVPLECASSVPTGGCAVSDDPCLCMGCVDDGQCTGEDDCVCGDCASDAWCGNPNNCDGDGICDPYLEGCACADCAAHPECICTPDCDGKACGPDGCGGQCGTCADMETCEAGVCNASPLEWSGRPLQDLECEGPVLTQQELLELFTPGRPNAEVRLGWNRWKATDDFHFALLPDQKFTHGPRTSTTWSQDCHPLTGCAEPIVKQGEAPGAAAIKIGVRPGPEFAASLSPTMSVWSSWPTITTTVGDFTTPLGSFESAQMQVRNRFTRSGPDTICFQYSSYEKELKGMSATVEEHRFHVSTTTIHVTPLPMEDRDFTPMIMPSEAAAVSESACGSVAGTNAEIIAGWFEPGSSKAHLPAPSVVHTGVRLCDSTLGCTEWLPSDRHWLPDRLQVSDQLSVDGSQMPRMGSYSHAVDAVVTDGEGSTYWNWKQWGNWDSKQGDVAIRLTDDCVVATYTWTTSLEPKGMTTTAQTLYAYSVVVIEK